MEPGTSGEPLRLSKKPRALGASPRNEFIGREEEETAGAPDEWIVRQIVA
jgi:hypothetical protein